MTLQGAMETGEKAAHDVLETLPKVEKSKAAKLNAKL